MSERDYFGDVVFNVYQRGGNPDLVDLDRVSVSRANGEQEIAARVEKATKGPWTMYVDTCARCEGEYGISELGHGRHSQFTERADADFIAHAREDIPYLLKELASERTARHALEQERDELLVAAKGYRTALRPWLDKAIGRPGTVSYAEWEAAVDRLEAAIAKAGG